jgi:hypothetical protein
MAELVITLNTLDATILQATPTVVHHAAVEHLHYGSGTFQRMLIKFDLSALPSTALVSAVKLELYAPLQYPTGPVTAYRITKAWNEGTVSWNVPWTSPGGDFSATVMSTATGITVRQGWNTIPLKPSEFDLMRAANHGIMISRVGEGDNANTIDINGRDASSNQPILTITYTNPGGTPPPPPPVTSSPESYKKNSHGLRYQVEHYDCDGNRVGTYESFNRLDYVKTRNTVGSMVMIMPYALVKEASFGLNNHLEIWREMDGVLELQNETSYFIKSVRYYNDNEGRKLVEITAKDGLDLLAGAIVDYPAASTQSTQEKFADDMIKDVVSQNRGTSAQTVRRLPRFTVAPKYGASKSLKKDFAWRNVLEVCTEIADDATEMGTHTSFDVVRVAPATFELRTYTGCRGIDHGHKSNEILRVGVVYGNLRNAEYGEYWGDERNAITAGGQGENANRIIARVADAKRIANGSPYNRRELFVDARDKKTTSAVTSEANAALLENRPKKALSGKLENTRGLKWNRDYYFGDILAAEAFGHNMDCHIESVRVTVDSKQNEQVNVLLRGEDDL